jgi:hypothetical protein
MASPGTRPSPFARETAGAYQQAKFAQGLGVTPELFDITPPAARMTPLIAGDDDLLVLGVPVYMGRVPGLLSPRLE